MKPSSRWNDSPLPWELLADGRSCQLPAKGRRLNLSVARAQAIAEVIAGSCEAISAWFEDEYIFFDKEAGALLSRRGAFMALSVYRASAVARPELPAFVIRQCAWEKTAAEVALQGDDAARWFVETGGGVRMDLRFTPTLPTQLEKALSDLRDSCRARHGDLVSGKVTAWETAVIEAWNLGGESHRIDMWTSSPAFPSYALIAENAILAAAEWSRSNLGILPSAPAELSYEVSLHDRLARLEVEFLSE
jgi:hypothetical protein